MIDPKNPLLAVTNCRVYKTRSNAMPEHKQRPYDSPFRGMIYALPIGLVLWALVILGVYLAMRG